MATLILEEGGNTRRFRLNQGKVTIGSSEACTLTLADENVAEVHAELELLAESATLRLKRGVMPAVVGGRKVTGEVALAHGVPVKIGNAKLSIEYEGKAKDGLVAKRTQKTRAEAAGAGAGAKKPRAAAQRTRPRVEVKRGAPTWLTLLILGGVIFAGYLGIKSYVGGAGKDVIEPSAVYARAVDKLDNHSSAAGALSEVNPALARSDLPPEWRTKFEELKARAESRLAQHSQAEENLAGTDFLDTQIKRFERNRLDGNSPPRVRVLLMRMNEFIERWPTHEERGWVERRIERFSKIVNLDDPPTFADVAFQVESMTWAYPRDYKGAFAILEQFNSTASAGDKAQVASLLDTMYVEQEEFFNERLEMAEWEWKDKGQKGKATARLVHLITMISDRELTNKAAGVLVKLPSIEEWLLIEKQQNPKRFKELVANSVVHEWAKGVEGLL